MGRVFYLKLRVEPDDDDNRTPEEVAHRVTDVIGAELPGDGTALATYETEKLPEKLIGSE
jgi:hypothetical protein